SRTDELLEVKAEMDQIAPADSWNRPTPCPRRRADDEIEAHAPHALLELEQVRRIGAAKDVPARSVDRLIGIKHFALSDVRAALRHAMTLCSASWFPLAHSIGEVD